MTTLRPTDRDTITALRVVGRALGTDAAYQHDGGFHFILSGGWSLRLSPDDAGRFRLSACYGATRVATLWALARDRDRLADLALAARQEIADLAASRD
jgi:hypothetical protein